MKNLSLTRFLVQAFIASLVLTGCSNPANSNASWADFWQPAPQRSIHTVTQRLKAMPSPLSQLGVVRYVDQDLPIPIVRVRRVAKQAPVCIFAGVHGNEIAGTEAALTLIDDLLKHKTLYPHTNFVIVPVVNPWGWERGFRYNFKGQDIARNFVLAGTQETVLIKSLLACEHCQLVVDLHEDSTHSGFYILSYANPDPAYPPRLVQTVEQDVGITAAAKVPQGVYQIAAHEFATNPRPTLAQYAREQGVQQTYIIETPMQLPVEQRVKIHRKVLDELMNDLL